jgi:hypothetical protein
MRADALAALLDIMCGHPHASSPVTPVTKVTPPFLPVTELVTGARGEPETPPVTPAIGLQVESPKLAGVTGVAGQDAQGGNNDCSPPDAAAIDFAEPDADAVEERAGLGVDRVPSAYLDAWAQLNCAKPARVSESEWRLALDDGGQFLDAWGGEAADMGWTLAELFPVTAGLVWRLAGERVVALGPSHIRLSDRCTIFSNREQQKEQQR